VNATRRGSPLFWRGITPACVAVFAGEVTIRRYALPGDNIVLCYEFGLGGQFAATGRRTRRQRSALP
jgi:hypothetical protein